MPNPTAAGLMPSSARAPVAPKAALAPVIPTQAPAQMSAGAAAASAQVRPPMGRGRPAIHPHWMNREE